MKVIPQIPNQPSQDYYGFRRNRSKTVGYHADQNGRQANKQWELRKKFANKGKL